MRWRSGSSAACMRKATASTQRRSARVRIFPRHRRQPCRRQSGHAAGALRRQRLRRARPLLSRRHPEFAGQAPIPSARARCSPMPRPISAIPTRSTISARLYLDGIGARAGSASRRRAGFGSPRSKGQYQAQALLGAMLFNGEHVPRQAARGLMWLTLAARRGAGADEAWIAELYDSAVQAGDRRRARAGAASISSAGWRRGASSSRRRSARHAPPSIARSIHTGTWSDGFSQPRTCLSMPAVDEPVGGLRRQQQVVDADAVVLLPGAGLIVPERVEARGRR